MVYKYVRKNKKAISNSSANTDINILSSIVDVLRTVSSTISVVPHVPQVDSMIVPTAVSTFFSCKRIGVSEETYSFFGIKPISSMAAPKIIRKSQKIEVLMSTPKSEQEIKFVKITNKKHFINELSGSTAINI